MPVKPLLTNILWSLAYLNAALYVGYYMLRLIGSVGDPIGWGGSAFELIILCLIAPLLPIFALSMRYRFNLLQMSDGTSKPSRFIWSTLSISLSLLMLYSFVVEIAM